MNSDRPNHKSTNSLLVGVMKTPTDSLINYLCFIILKRKDGHKGMARGMGADPG